LEGFLIDLLELEGFDDITDFDVVESLDTDAAFISRFHFSDILLEAAEGGHAALVHDDVVSQEANLRSSQHLPVHHIGSRDCADLGNLEGVANLGPSQVELAHLRLQETHHGAFDLVMDLVDYRVRSNVYLLLLRQLRGGAIRPDIESDDHGVARRGKEHVGLGDGARAGVNQANLDLVGGEVPETLDEHLDRALNVGLQHDR